MVVHLTSFQIQLCTHPRSLFMQNNTKFTLLFSLALQLLCKTSSMKKATKKSSVLQLFKLAVRSQVIVHVKQQPIFRLGIPRANSTGAHVRCASIDCLACMCMHPWYFASVASSCGSCNAGARDAGLMTCGIVRGSWRDA